MKSPTVYVCSYCGLLFGRKRAVNGKTPEHYFTEPLQGLCPGSGEEPKVFGERRGELIPLSARRERAT